MTTPRQNVTFPSGAGEAHGYLALPPSGSGPGVVVIQEWWGLTSHIADITDRLALQGFVALAPDLYGGTTTHDGAEAEKLLMALPVEQAAADLLGAVDYLLGLDAVSTSTVGAIGFCMGGGFVLELAKVAGPKVSAAIPFYGVGKVQPEPTKISAAVQGHYASDDAFLPVAQAEALEQSLKDAGVDTEFFYYSAGHAFVNDENLIGTYDEAHAVLAFDRAVEFLRRKVS